MELFTNSNKEHLTNIIEYFINQVFESYGNSLSDIIYEFRNAGFTRNEILNILNKRYLDSYEWKEEESEVNEKVNTETGEGIFWNEYTEDEDINVGDTDQAILETALTQIGIEYEFHKANGDNWVEILTPCNYSVEFLFNDKGDFLQVLC